VTQTSNHALVEKANKTQQELLEAEQAKQTLDEKVKQMPCACSLLWGEQAYVFMRDHVCVFVYI
jgi:hypothetical protein